MPRSMSAACTCSPANGSSRPSRRGSASTIVTCAPSECQACPSSTPTTPPPSTISRSGTRFGRRRLAVRPRARLGEARDRRQRGLAAGREHDGALAPRARGRRRRPGARRRAVPCPRTSVDAALLEPREPARSRRGRAPPRRAGASTAPTSSSPVTASRAPGIRRASAIASAGRSSAFDGMQP